MESLVFYTTNLSPAARSIRRGESSDACVLFADVLLRRARMPHRPKSGSTHRTRN